MSKVGNQTNSQDPQAVNSRVFVGNLNTFQCSKTDVERMFQRYGRLAGRFLPVESHKRKPGSASTPDIFQILSLDRHTSDVSTTKNFFPSRDTLSQIIIIVASDFLKMIQISLNYFR